jgi:hypothetical protein
MALDLYVGGFARFYAREWENVIQRWARESGEKYYLIGPDGPVVGPDGPLHTHDWNDIAEGVNCWRTAINRGLGKNIDRPLEWDETRAAPYFTDRLTYEGYGALLVWASHAELGTTPPKLYDGAWYSDPAFEQCCVATPHRRYPAVTCASLWLPGTFEFSFDFEDIADLTGPKVHIASNLSLERNLRRLNAETFGMAPDELETARGVEVGDDSTLAEWARFGLVVFLALAVKSVEYHLPIKLSV